MLLKKISIIFIILFSFFSFWINYTKAAWPTGGREEERVWNVYDMFTDGLKEWFKKVKDTVTIVEKDKPFHKYVQDLVVWILGFLSLIALVYIIWAWLNIMISWSDDEKMKAQKKTIFSVIIWIIIIWLAYSIVLTLFKWLNNEPTWWWNNWTQYNQID